MAEDTSMIIDWLKLLVETLGFGTAVWTARDGISQYNDAQRWKRLSYAARLMDRFGSDPDMALCKTLLDWTPRSVSIPDRHRLLFAKTDDSFVHSATKMATAMRSPTQAGYAPSSVVYRDVFDVLFTFLDYLNQGIISGFVLTADLPDLRYWLAAIAAASDGDHPIFEEFVNDYYPAVGKMIVRQGLKWGVAEARLLKVPAFQGLKSQSS